MQDVAGDLAAGAPTSSEHIEDGASDVTVMEMDMDNGSDHDRHDQRGGGMEEGRRGDLEAVNGEKGTSARQPRKYRLTLCYTPGGDKRYFPPPPPFESWDYEKNAIAV